METGLDLCLAADSKTENGSASASSTWGCPPDDDDYSIVDLHELKYGIKNWMYLDGTKGGIEDEEVLELDKEEVWQVFKASSPEAPALKLDLNSSLADEVL